jgi:hypothetical protein
MKILQLIKANVGVPFYQLKPGAFFQIVIMDHEGVVRPRSPYFYEDQPILMKVDAIGAIDFPYTQKNDERLQFVQEKTLVYVVKKTTKSFKAYIKEKQGL